MRCGISRSTNRSSSRSSRNQGFSILPTPSLNTTSTTCSSFYKPPLIRSEDNLDRFNDAVHFRASWCSETRNEIVRAGQYVLHQSVLVRHDCC
jgi:hypothetical protein